MATQEAIAIMRANALRDLKQTGEDIASQLGIDPPQLNFFYPNKDYQQAQELAALVDFNTRLLSALQAPAEGVNDGLPSSTEIPERRQHRTVASKRN